VGVLSGVGGGVAGGSAPPGGVGRGRVVPDSCRRSDYTLRFPRQLVTPGPSQVVCLARS
jgi:hypothetical protein